MSGVCVYLNIQNNKTMLQIGFTEQYYTLWDVENSNSYATINGRSYISGVSTNYTYMQNLSMQLDLAQDKAKGFGCENLTPDDSLRGKNRSWESYKKSPEQIEIEEAQRVEKDRIDSEAADLKNDNIAKYQAFNDQFLSGREFTTCSNFRLSDSNVCISFTFEPLNDWEQERQDDNPYGCDLMIPFLKAEDVVKREYQGYEYYVLAGYRTMKNKTMKIVNSELIIS